MARPLRIERAGGWYHVTARGNERRPIFHDDRDRQLGLEVIEEVKGRLWADFRDEHGDTGRDLALYLGRRLCGMKLRELAKAVDLRNYGVVATNAGRYERRLEIDCAEKAQLKQVVRLLNCEI